VGAPDAAHQLGQNQHRRAQEEPVCEQHLQRNASRRRVVAVLGREHVESGKELPFPDDLNRHQRRGVHQVVVVLAEHHQVLQKEGQRDLDVGAAQREEVRRVAHDVPRGRRVVQQRAYITARHAIESLHDTPVGLHECQYVTIKLRPRYD